MKTIVVKFGGSSLASAGQFEKVADIIRAEPARRYVVASAPGKRDSADTKVTDLLYRCYDLASAKEDFSPVLSQIEARFSDIAAELGLAFDVAGEIAVIRKHLGHNPQRDYMASRGEYLNSKLLAAFLGYDFLDPAQAVRFFPDGSFDSETTNENLAAALSGSERCVVAGFYGAFADGTIHTFSRGGSDVTGSLAAAALHADLYENWTDVTGILAADPRIVTNPVSIAQLSYEELQALSHVGTQVLHESAVEPVRRRQIPLQIRNTWQPELPGTLIGLPRADCSTEPSIVGFAGRRNLAMLRVFSSGIARQSGEILKALSLAGLRVFYSACALEQLTVLIDADGSSERLHECTERLRAGLPEAQLKLRENLSVLAALLRGTDYLPKLVAAVEANGVPVHYLADTRPCLLMIVNDSQYEAALRAAYSSCQIIN